MALIVSVCSSLNSWWQHHLSVFVTLAHCFPRLSYLSILTNSTLLATCVSPYTYGMHWRDFVSTCAIRRYSAIWPHYFLVIFACSAAKRSANQGWRVLHSCGVSSRATASGCVCTSAIAARVFLVSITSSRGALAARAAIS